MSELTGSAISRQWYEVVYQQDSEAEDVLQMLREERVDEAIAHLAMMDEDAAETERLAGFWGRVYDAVPEHVCDWRDEDERYVIVWNPSLNYVALYAPCALTAEEREF